MMKRFSERSITAVVAGACCLAGAAFEFQSGELATVAVAKETIPIFVQEADPEQAYVGSDGCFTCHRTQGGSWSETKHAKAFENLPEKYRNDASCLQCHVTAYGEPSGYVADMAAEAAKPFLNVGCESCHGPGAAHVAGVQSWMTAAPADEENLLKAMKAAIVKTPTDSLCATCHKTQTHQVHPPYDGQPLPSAAAFHPKFDSSPNATAATESLPGSPHSYSVKTCGSCHYSQYQQWRVEAHADLAADLPVKYDNDESCLTCHQQAGEPSDWFADAAETKTDAGRLGVGCESCHGSALKHVMYNKQNLSGAVLTAERVQAARELMRNEKQSSACSQCHIREGHKAHPEIEKSDDANTK